MDFAGIKQRIRDSTKKFRAALIVILAGILLMAMPSPGKKPEAPETVPPEIQRPGLSQSLEAILSSVEGAGRVEVLLTEDTGPQNSFVFNEDRGESGSLKRTAVVISDRSQGELGLIRLVTAPRYRGAVVLSQGAQRASVRLAIVQAVASATGLSADKITVLKMK